MKKFKVVQQSTNLRYILKEFFTLAILLGVINGSEGNKPSDENLQDIRNGSETVAATPNESKTSNIKVKIADEGSSFGGVKNIKNSPALNSFLRNVLQAQDELKWIDQAVRRDGTKEVQGKSPRYSPESFNDPALRYRFKTRTKRRSGNGLDEFESWPSSSSRKYRDEESAGGRQQSIYLEEEAEEDERGGDQEEEEEGDDEEMKVKRYVNPSDFDGDLLSPNLGIKQGRSNLDERSASAVDDSTLKRWARKEGLKVPGSWFESEDRKGNSERVNRMNDLSRGSDRWIENPSRGDHDAVAETQGKNSEDSVSEQPTLESLKRTVLELSRSLADSDRKMEELDESSARNRERHVEDLAGRKESRTKGEHERATSTYVGSAEDRRNGIGKEMSGLDSSSLSSSWWEDPRSAAEIFDFKRRDDDETDEENDEEDSEPGNSEFDYMMQRVKREQDGDRAGARVRVYRRAGFGGSYPEVVEREKPYERSKRSKSEKDLEENIIAKNSEREGVNAVRLGSYEAGVGEIRGAGLEDKIINVENSDGEKVARARIAEVNVNENGDNFWGKDEKINKREEKRGEEEKNASGYNPVEKDTEGGTIGDPNLENVKSASFPVDEKRSPSLRGSEEEHEQRLSVAVDGETPLDESSSNRIKSELDGLLKNTAIELPAEKIANEKDGQEIEGGKIEERKIQSAEDNSEKIGNEVRDKLSEELNERKKDEGKFTDPIVESSDEQKKSNNEANEAAIVNKEETDAAKEDVGILENKIRDKHAEGESSEKGKSKPEGLTNLSGENKTESADELTADSKMNQIEDNSLEIYGEKENSNPKEQGQPNNRDTSKIIKLTEPRIESDIKLSSDKGGKEMEYKHGEGSYDEDKRLIRYSDKDNAKYHSTLSNGRDVQAEVVEENDQELGSDNNKDKEIKNTEVKDAEIKGDQSTRKLLWLSSERLDSKYPTEIRDGRRDSAWDQKDGGKTGQRPANLLENSQEVMKFNKRSLMVADHRSMGNNNAVGYKRQKRRRVMRKGRKRSVKSYPENMEDDNAMEEVAREDKEDVHRSEARKRSLKRLTEYRREPDTVDQVKYDQGFGQNDEAVQDSGVSDEEGENALLESETQAESSPVSGSSHRDEDRDPIRDRINMLIKQKLDDRGKGKQAHLKREVGAEVGNIEYYDYEGDVNGGKSEVGSSAGDNDQPQNVTNQETSTSSTSESSSTDSSEPLIKKDEIAEEERKQALEHEELNNRGPKEEFIPDPDAAATQKKSSQEGDIAMGGGSPSEGDQNRSKDEEIKNILRGAESSDDNNERRENEVTKSNYNQWLAQPIEANPVEEDMRNIPKDRFEDTGESKEQNRPIENERNDGLEDPLDYSVNLHRKMNPDSLDDVLGEKQNVKASEEEVKDEKSMRYDERNRNDPGENENGASNDEPIAADEHWKYEEIKDKARSKDDQKANDEELESDHAVGPYNEKVSRRHWSYKDSARVEEENNAQGSPLDSFSRNTDDQDQILENKSQSKKSAEQDAVSQEARLIDESAEDSLPTMLDRSGPRNLAPGESTYLMIAPISEVESPRETVDGGNSSSSSSGSNYLALKTTDDMFKGGIEQSNPADEKITEPDIMRKTTTEWRVINMGYDARAKPVTGRYPSSPSSVSSEDEGMMKPDSNLEYEFSEVGYQELGLNPRDVAHESIVDPEEMAADFDDDLMPRLGRNLQSVSYPIDLYNEIERTGDGERPAEKYLENTQIGFERERGASHRIHKRETKNLSKPSSSSYMEDGDHEVDEGNINVGKNVVPSGSDSEKKIAKRNSPANEDSNLTRINDNVDGGKSIGRRSLEGETQLGHRGSDHEIDKDKRGLTNVEEWEMNAPNVQKQRMITRLVKKEVDLPNVERNYSEVQSIDGSREDKKIDSNFKTEDKSPRDLEHHDRETRSIKSKDGNVKPYVSLGGTRNKKQNAGSFPGKRMRSKIRRRAKSYDKFRPKLNPFISSRGSNSRDNWNGGYARTGDNSLEKSRDKKRNVFEKRSESEDEKKKLNTKESSNRKRHPNQSSYSSSKRDKFWHPRHSNHKKTVNESATNRKHSSRELRKHHGGDQAKKTSSSEKVHPKRAKNQKKRTRFKDVLREGHANGNRQMIAIAADGPRGGYSDSLEAPKAFNSGMQRQGEGRVLDENAEDGDQNARPDDEAEKNEQKKKFKVLLAADNMEDESQMDLALHGELAGKIVERIFDQVQKNDALKVALGPGLFRKHKSEDAVESDKIYRQGLDEDEVKHTEAMMRRVMELLGRLVLDEVQRKTCASLPPDMREFLQWMLGVEDEDKSSDQAPPLPLVHSQEPNHRQDDKFLFGGPLGHNENADLDELNKKVRLLKGLINEYSSLTSKEKTKVQTVHDYLVRQLGLLMSYIDAKEGAGNNEKNVRLEGGNILQYQNAMPNLNDTVASQSTLSPLVNTPSILMLSNASFNGDHPYKSIIPYYSRLRRRETRSSDHEVKKRAKKHKKHKKHKSHKHKNKNKHKHGKSPPGKESPQYEKLIRKAASLRKKRADLYEDDWDPVDSGYEEPAIYTSSGELANGVAKQRRSISRDRKKPEEYDKTINPYFWADVLSGKSNENEEFDDRMSSLEKNSASEEPQQLTGPESISFSNSMEKRQMDEKVFPGQQVKRDVLSASMALQPWINPKSDDSVSSKYLSKLTDELVHGALVPPIYSDNRNGEEKKREVKEKNSQESSKERNLADQEAILLSKREVWKAQNEQQLEEVAFGKDMRGKWKDEERFKKLTEMDKKKRVKERGGRRRKREGEIETRSFDDRWSEKSMNEDKSVDKKIESVEEKDESEVTAGVRKENDAVKGGEDFAATGEKVNLISEDLRNLSAIGDSENSIRDIEIRGTLEKLKPVPPNTESINSMPNPTSIREQKNEADDESSRIVSTLKNGDSERVKEAKEKEERLKKVEDGNRQRVENFFPVSRAVLPWEKISKISNDDNSGEKMSLRSGSTSNTPIDKRKTKRASSIFKEEIEGSAILPLLEVSEQRQQQTQASKAEKDDQRDIADQTLGLESPLIIGLNTY